jgi:hypothetical protein
MASPTPINATLPGSGMGAPTAARPRVPVKPLVGPGKTAVAVPKLSRL